MIFFETAYAATTAKVVDSTQSLATSQFGSFMALLPKIAVALIVFVGTFFVARAVKGIVSLRLRNKDLPQEVIILVERVVHSGIIILGIVISFQVVGINVGSLFAFLGVGIGFAMKDLLSNFFAGVMILTQKKFKIGDTIKIGDRLGKITEIDTRTTQVKAFDGTNLIIPNATMITEVLQNYTANTFRRISFPVGIHYSTPIGDAINVALGAVKKHQSVVPEPRPSVVATEFGDSAITLDVKFWIESKDSWLQIRSEIIQLLKIDFDAAEIEIPFPIRTLTLDDNDANLMRALHQPVKTGIKMPK
jgi:small-conductance mechanosensitive channel